MKRQILQFLALTGVFLGILAGALAEQIVLNPSKDATLYQDQTGSLANGKGTAFFAGRAGAVGDPIRRGVLAFDLSTIPPGSVVNSVQLDLRQSNTNNNSSSPVGVGLHRVLKDWGEGTTVAGRGGGSGGASTTGSATWIHTFFNTGFWSAAGGDFNAPASATTDVAGNGNYSWGSSPGMVADVQFWIDNPGSNFGWLVKSTEAAGSDAKRFDSREGISKPALTIDFTRAAEPELEFSVYFAQFGNGAGFFSQITLLNPDPDQSAQARVVVKDDSGEAFPLVLNGEFDADGVVDLTLPPAGSHILRTDAMGTVKTGAVTVLSSIPITGVVVFGGVFGLAGVQAGDDFSGGFVGPIEVLQSQGINTGVAIQNLDNESKLLNAELIGLNGELLSNGQLMVPGSGHIAVFVTDVQAFNWSPALDLSNLEATLRITFDGDVSAIMIQVRPQQFATLPVAQLP